MGCMEAREVPGDLWEEKKNWGPEDVLGNLGDSIKETI